MAGNQTYNLSITRKTLYQELSDLIQHKKSRNRAPLIFTESKKCKRLWIKVCEDFFLFFFIFLLFYRFVEVWIIRVNRYRRRRRQPWLYTPEDYANRRHGLILVRRIYSLIILRQPFTCGGELTRRRRTIGDEDSEEGGIYSIICLLYTSPSPRDKRQSRMPSSA